MTIFLILLVVALLGVTFWQLSKILEISKGNTEGNNGVANDKDNAMQGKLMLAFVIFLYALTAYCFINYWSYFLPDGSSSHSADYDNLMMISTVLIMFVQTLTQGFLHYFAYKYKGKEGNKATYFADSNTLELVWTIIPIITLAGLIIYGLYTWTEIMSFDEEEDTIVVELYAYQFGWRARYSGSDNELGKANVRFIEGVNALGVDASDSYAQDDIITDVLHLPVNKKIHFKLRSQDVLHSAYMPFFRAQMNVVPGMITEFAYTPIQTTEEIRETEFMIEKVNTINKIRTEKSKDLIAKGEEPLEPYEFDYYLLCNKICGASHFNMQMKIIVESEEDYNNWIAEQKTFRQVVSK